MSLKSAPYWWVECNNCGTRCEYGDFAAMSESSAAIDGAVNADWSHHGEKDHCDRCPPLCENCGENSGDLSGERDYQCQPCFDKALRANRDKMQDDWDEAHHA